MIKSQLLLSINNNTIARVLAGGTSILFINVPYGVLLATILIQLILKRDFCFEQL
ncbi:hypothetical protein BN1221_04150c [Brenneria goodwinii]|uniref:Uncharacterized protein n=1 Tax=Brenneria goodwinii TaxID=1109412 RepID=A0A0G4K0A6_9GAMM|nr:hypothetical protein BN1221_04150c [Brenneria goodwinii]